MTRQGRKGIVLIEIIMVIVLLGIIAFAVMAYISESLRYSISNLNQEKALYMAQAGLMSAIVDYLDDGSWSPQSNINVEGEFYYSVGGESGSFLLVDATDVRANGHVVNHWPISNIGSSPLTITSLVVEWTFGGNIDRVKLGNNFVYTGPAAPSPASLDITDFTIAAGTSYNNNNDQYLHFDTSVSGGTLSVTFIFSDGSSLKAYLLRSGNNANNEFYIKATGKIQSGSLVVARRTLVATYDTGIGKITSWEESSSHIIP